MSIAERVRAFLELSEVFLLQSADELAIDGLLPLDRADDGGGEAGDRLRGRLADQPARREPERRHAGENGFPRAVAAIP